MTDEEDEEGNTTIAPAASYLIRPLVQDIPLTSEDQQGKAHVTCVELCGDNLYIGTSQSEILHYVSIPPDPPDSSQTPSYIFASRLQPAHNAQATSSFQPGVQQILVLPKVQKACVLCNGTLSFYTLPELSPAFGNTTVANCTWVGGVDLNHTNDADAHGVVVMICVKNKVRLVRIADEVRRVKDIQYPGCLTSSRRGGFACVADNQGYALLDIEDQQKISLFPISSLDENSATGKVEDVSGGDNLTPARASSSSRPTSGAGEEKKTHGRSTSLGTLVGNIARSQRSRSPGDQQRAEGNTPEPFLEQAPSRQPINPQDGYGDGTATPLPATPNKPLPVPPRSDSLRPPKARDHMLRPHICSPTPNEFLLTTGTTSTDSGVGLFVNLDGDVVRGTIEFSCYPTSIVVDSSSSYDDERSTETDHDSAGFVLAVISRAINDTQQIGLEVQRWDTGENGSKEWIRLPHHTYEDISRGHGHDSAPPGYGMRTVDTPIKLVNQSVGALLKMKRLSVMKANEADLPGNTKADAARNKEEASFGRRLGGVTTKLALWSDSTVWSVSRTPLVMKLDEALSRAMTSTSRPVEFNGIDRSAIIRVISSIRGLEPSTETEFLTLEYIRQKASIILFADLLQRPNNISDLPTADMRIMEALLMEGGIDPRVILSMTIPLKEEVVEGNEGIWIHNGLVRIVELYLEQVSASTSLATHQEVLQLLKRYLQAWIQRKGFGSIANESEVFKTVEAALLRVLLLLDGRTRSLPSRPSSERQELYTFVDSALDCFDRAAVILEKESRLFSLSRLYQSRRMARKVLGTWQRIIEGENDRDNGLVDGENEVRRYLTNVRDHAIVDEFGTWLAGRNPSVGVQIFTNEASKVKWEPHQVVLLLRRRAPNAVKYYLEHLVFGKKNVQYANDLIGYYLDSVLTVLSSSDEARERLAQTYEFYRALRPPKPTYREYITENALSDSWWHDRLRLLELIGGSHGSDFTYDVQQVLTRIEPFEQELVPESIILDGRQGRHKQALRLLTHGLGDYHTAVNYCLLGGASIFHPTQGSVSTPPSQQEQSLLFNHLLTEFLLIEDVSDRLERTSELLARFSAWFDVQQVLNLIPDTWSVELASGFLIKAFRRLVQEKNEATITRALSGAENLQIAHDFVEKCIKLGPQVESAEIS